MPEMSLDEMAKNIVATQGAIHLLVMSLIDKEAIAAKNAVDILEMLSKGSEQTASHVSDALEKLRRLAELEAKSL